MRTTLDRPRPQARGRAVSQSLGEAYREEQARVRTILGYYKEIGPAGAFGAMMIEDVLRRADKAAIEGDVVAMVGLYKEMQEIQA